MEAEQLLKVQGPVTSVLVTSPSNTADAAAQLEVRWRNARSELEGLGVEAGSLGQLDATFAEVDHGAGEAVVAYRAEDGTVLVDSLDHAPDDEVSVAHDELPRLSWLLASRQRQLAHLLVVTDRSGAELTACGPHGDEQHESVQGDTLHLHRSHPGGWSQRRFQQRAENQWESNAAEVADAVAEAVREVGAEVVVVTGDVRARTFLMEHLPPEVAELVTVTEEGSSDGIEQAVDTAVATAVAARTAQLLSDFGDAKFTDTAANGEAEVLLALTEGRVATLLVHDDPADDRRARFDPDSAWCAPVGDSEQPVPISDPPVGRLVDVAIRSALLGGAEVRFVPAHGGPDGHLGALLRW